MGRMRLILVGLFLAVYGVTLTNSEGVFELRLLAYNNQHGRDAQGRCCGGPSSQPSPSSLCDVPCNTFFRICLKQYQNYIDPNPPCIYGSTLTEIIGDIVTQGQPMQFPFTIAWPGTFTLIVEAWHDSKGPNTTAGSKQLLLRYAEAKTLAPSQEWEVEVHATNGSRMELQYRVSCAEHYYGDKCMTYCRPKDDGYGHYQCNHDGIRQCKMGWDGPLCDKPVCRAGCHPLNGHCEAPGECVCKMGYTGERCDECIKYPGCKRGSCRLPFECNCDEGWGGMFCNQDLNFCTHHRPCLNGATCTNTGRGHYTCTCRPGYTGTNCEIRLQDCTQRPCVNGGICRELKSNYTCDCAEGFSGRHCQISATRCSENPCVNGATCIDRVDYGVDGSGGGYTCICADGWQGPNCDVQQHQCQTNPCLNGGRCVEKFTGYQCVCEVGYEGQQCERNVDDCTANACLNGGTCVDGVSDFRCICRPGWMGKLCQENYDDCVKRPCANGGTCFDLIDDYRCMCRPGFSGKDCSIDVNECASSPCRNGAACEDTIDDYNCRCTSDCFTGKNCQIRNDDCLYSHTFGPHLVAYNQTRAPPVAPGEAKKNRGLMHDVVVAVGIPLLLLFLLIVVILLAIVVLLYRRTRKRQPGELEATQNYRNELRAAEAARAGSNNRNLSGQLRKPPPSPCRQLVVPNSYLEFQKPKVENTDRSYAVVAKKLEAEQDEVDYVVAAVHRYASVNENPVPYKAVSLDKLNGKKRLKSADVSPTAAPQPSTSFAPLKSDRSKDSGLGSPSDLRSSLPWHSSAEELDEDEQLSLCVTVPTTDSNSRTASAGGVSEPTTSVAPCSAPSLRRQSNQPSHRPPVPPSSNRRTYVDSAKHRTANRLPPPSASSVTSLPISSDETSDYVSEV